MDRKSMIALAICTAALLAVAACGGGGGGGGDTPDTQAPSVPAGLVSSPVSTSQISLTWSASSDDRGVAGYRVYRVSDIQSKTTTTFHATSSGAPYNHTGLAQSTYYCYYVSAYDAAGNESAKSSMACATTYMELYVVPDTGGDDHVVTSTTVSRPPTYEIISGSTSTIVSYPAFTIDAITYPTYTIVNSAVTDTWTKLSWQQESDNMPRTWTEANDYCNNLTLADEMDWRLPTRKELLSMVHYGTSYPAWMMDIFLSAPSEALEVSLWSRYEYWSATRVPAAVSPIARAWTVNFEKGVANYYELTQKHYVRCVRGGQLPSPQYTDNNNGTVTDGTTGLVWHKLATAVTGTWKTGIWTDALNSCASSNLDGQTWRLPNIRELGTLIDDTKTSPSIDNSYFTDGRTILNEFYWSSTTVENTANAWVVWFSNGRMGEESKSFPRSVRCVRNAP